MSRVVLILGASYAGIVLSHKLLKHTRSEAKDLKVVLVNPSTHFYWNLASIRAIIPGQINDKEIFQDISDGFRYPPEVFEFVEGFAESVDEEKKSVTIRTATREQKQVYDFLIITTGARTVNKLVPWKASGTYEDMLESLHEAQKKVEKAQRIIIAGGGATGLELAGELGFEYRDKKDIKLIIADKVVMEQSYPPYISKIIENELEKLKIKVIRNAKVTDTAVASNGQTEVTLESGEKVVADLFLPTFGLITNSTFLPPKFLGEKGKVVVDEYFGVKGATAIYALGDVADIERCAWVHTIAQAEHLSKNLDLILKGKAPLPYKSSKEILVVSIGRSKGTGLVGGWRLPSLFAWMGKGRTLARERMNGLVTGSSL